MRNSLYDLRYTQRLRALHSVDTEIAAIQGRLLLAGLDAADVVDLEEQSRRECTFPEDRHSFWERQARQMEVA